MKVLHVRPVSGLSHSSAGVAYGLPAQAWFPFVINCFSARHRKGLSGQKGGTALQRCLPGAFLDPSVSALCFLFSCCRSLLLLLIPQIKASLSQEGPGFMALSSSLV